MNDATTGLADLCAQVQGAAKDAVAWISDPANETHTKKRERSELLRGLRQASRRAAKLHRATARNLAVSVFGPSQAGKSFLVSVLARPEGGRLIADYGGGDGQLDYISQVNPEGEGESTGLVTRFTMSRPSTPEGFPIPLTLLSEADILRTLVNSFYMDGDQSEPPPEPDELSDRIRTAPRGASARPGLDADDIWEIAEYTRANFGRTAYASHLDAFWEDAAEIAPTLDVDARAEFLSVLWGGHALFTNLYRKLAAALLELGHPEEVHAPIAALVPRETSIIDVATLKVLDGAPDSALLELHGPTGVRRLPRAVACALAAEMTLPMRDLPDPLFKSLDLLDFPGARNRFAKPLSPKSAAEPPIASELLLRGKVAYLFDRYVEDQEITSMLLCVPDSNMETVDLPGLIDNWIAATHGATPTARKGRDNNLFFVLTKFDKHMSESAAASGETSRFTKRVEKSLLEKFGLQSDPWVRDWANGKPFDNCFWLRNPNFFVKALYDYDDDARETLRPSEAPALEKLRAGYLESDLVQRHFADPARAWDAAVEPNDGGVSYLLRSLETVCRPDTKDRQIEGQLDTLRARLHGSLDRFHVPSDFEALRAQKKEAAEAIIDRLDLAVEHQVFGALMGALMADQDQVTDGIARVPSSINIVAQGRSPAVAAPTAAAAPARAGRIRPGGRSAAAAESAPAAEAEPKVESMSREEFQARTALRIWQDGLVRLRDDPARVRRLRMTSQTMSDLVSELRAAARRHDLAAQIVTRLGAVGYGLTIDQHARPAALICTEVINRFVEKLGYAETALSDRPEVPQPDGGTRPVFAPRRESAVADLPEIPRAIVDETWNDWVFALDAMFQDNARSVGTMDVDEEQNTRIGAILAAIGWHPA